MGITRAPRAGETVCGYRLLRELGSRASPWFVATKSDKSDKSKPGPAPPRVIIEVFEESESILRSARALARLRHSKLVPVRDVVVEGGLVAVVGDFVDGEWLADLFETGWKSTPTISLGAQLRVLVDVMEGLSALHGARGPSNEPLHLVHGEVAASRVLVGVDGVARITRSLRPVAAAEPSPEVTGYLAPEVLLHDQSADTRADVFSVGVLLWEMLSGRRLHASTHAGEIVVRLLGGKVQLAEVPSGSPWARPLADVAKRALSPELAARYSTAAEMIAAVRRIAGEKLAPCHEVRALVHSLAGAKIRARASGQASGTQVAAPPPLLARFAVPSAPSPPAPIDPSSSAPADTPTLVPPRSSPAPASSALVEGAVPSSVELELELDSERPTAAPSVPLPPRVAPKPPPVPRLSLPTPIIPIASVTAFARASASSAPELAPLALPLPPPAPPLPDTVPHRFERVSIAEATDAPISLTASHDSAPPRARSRRYAALLLVAAAVVALPGVAGLAWVGLGRGSAPPGTAKQPSEPDRGAESVSAVAVPPAEPVEPSPIIAAPSPLEAADASTAPSLEAAQRPALAPAPATPASASMETVAPPPPPSSRKPRTTYLPLGI